MEEVWGKVSLPCIHNPNPTTNLPNMGGATNFHDFFNMKDPFLDDPTLLMAHPPISSFKPRNHLLYDCLQTPSPQMAIPSKKRPTNDDDSAAERRRKRLIKNRESADRSRARRLAYTNELEQEMEVLKKENASLRAQLEEVKPRAHLEKVGISISSSTATATAATTTNIWSTTTAAAAAGANQQQQQLNSRKGNSLCRTLTAPF